MANNANTYQAYLLRFWRRDEAKPWRVTVQCVGFEQHYNFASVGEAIDFVQDQLEQPELIRLGHYPDSVYIRVAPDP